MPITNGTCRFEQGTCSTGLQELDFTFMSWFGNAVDPGKRRLTAYMPAYAIRIERLDKAVARQ